MYQFPEEIRKAYEAMPSALVFDQYIDGKVVPLLISDGFCELVGMDREHAMEWFKEGQFERLHPDDVGRVARVSTEFANHRSGYDLVFRSRHADGYHVLHAVGKWQTMPDGTELALLTYSDITESFDAMAGLAEDYNLFRTDQFYTDPLTGFPNLNYLNQFSDEWVHALRTQGKTPVLIYADVISMHYYNSQYGSQKGNELLKQIADTLKKAFPDALIMRGQDDHFILIDGFESQEKIIERIVSVDNRIQKEAEGNTTGIKAGACVYEEHIKTVEALDRARIAIKWTGTDLTKVCYFYSHAAEDQFWNQQYIIENLDTAIREKWIQVYLQPIIRAVSEQVCDVEALARWVDPEKGVLPPASFIPVLEKAGLIYKLDLYMVDQVLESIKTQIADGFYVIPHSINLSRSDFDACDIVEEIRKRVDAAGVKRDRITIEITESVIGSDFAFIKEQVERFRKLGFPVWMDDFGSGYSSLDILQSVKFDLLKFDMSFMRKLDEGDDGRVVLTELMRLATSLGIDTVCEGVETESQIRFLQEIGCSKLQGYYYSKPIPFETIREMHRSRTLIKNENPEESDYYESIGRVNLFDFGVIASEDVNAMQNTFSTIPIAILEIKDDMARYVRSNRSYQDFVKRFFGSDILQGQVSFGDSSIGYGTTFISVVKQCCEHGSRAFFDEKMPDGSIVHSFVRRINVNPVTGNTAVAIAVLSVTEPDERTTYADIAKSLAADYYNIYVIDLDTEHYIEYSSQVGGEELSIERHGEGFFDSARRDTMTRIYEEDREPFLKWFTKENVLHELDTQGVFTTTYRLIDTGTPMYVNMKITRMQGGNRIILGVSVIDAQMKQQEEEKRLRQERISLGRIAALAGNYIALYIVYPVTEQFVKYSSSKEYAQLGLTEKGEAFFSQVKKDGQEVLYPEDMERLLCVLTKENVLQEIRQNGLFIHNYRLLIEGKYVPVSLRATTVRENDGEKILFGVNRLFAKEPTTNESEIIYTHIAYALARGYTDLYYVNMDTDEFIEYHTDDNLGVLTEARRGADFFEGCERDVKLFVHPEDQKKFVEAMNREFLIEALNQSKVYELTYRRIKDGRSFYVKMEVSRMEDDKRLLVIAVSDVDELMKKRREEKRMKEERVIYARLHAITGNFICVYVVDPETGRYREFSATINYEESFAQAKEGTDFFPTLRDAARIYSHPEDTDRVMSLLTRENVMAEIERSGIFTLGYRLVAEGRSFHVQLKAAMVEEEEGRRLIVGLNDIDAQVRQEEEYGRRLEKAQTQASIDALTGVKNKYAYLETEARMDRWIQEGRQPPFAVVVLDVNDLKKVNDSAGHQAGDQYLRDACKIICETFKHSPVFRVGGDEFTVISEGKDYACIDELVKIVSAHNMEASRAGGIMIAYGMAKYENDACVADVFERADHSMYENKTG